MQLEGYRFPSSALPIEAAVRSWEEANGVTLGITNASIHLPLIDGCDVKWVIGNMAPHAPGSDPYTYRSFSAVNVGEILPAAGWGRDEISNWYDVTVPYPEQIAMLPDPTPLDWSGSYEDGNGERKLLPLWHRDEELNVLYMTTPNNLPYMKPEIVTELLDLMLDGLGDPEERALQAHKRAMTNLVKYFADGASVDLNNLRDEIGNETRNVAINERAAVQLRASLRDKQQRLDLLIEQSGAHDAAQAAADAFEAMGHHKQIASVKFVGNDLRVETVGLDIEHPTTGCIAYLGQFSITLNIQSGNVKLKNNDNARNGYDHPHVFIGSPCFGDMDSTIMELTRAGQLLGALEMVFVFLSSVNVRDDWGRSLSYWMEGNAERPTETPELVSA